MEAAHGDALPALETLVDAADEGLHPWVHSHVPAGVRRAALEEELGFWLHTAAQDLDYARRYAADAPQSGQPPEAYLDRWLTLADGGHVLAGPRYLGQDPNLPFVGVSASDRVLRPADAGALAELARVSFAPFRPGFVLVTTADGADEWPGAGNEKRLLVGQLGELRARKTPMELTTTPRTDTDFYDRYLEIHETQVERQPAHGRHTRAEAKADLQALVEKRLVFDVRVDGEWAGVLAAEPDADRGMRGATVVELLLAPEQRGRGWGRHLSVLLAHALSMDDGDCLMGRIHLDNASAYRSALAAGRVDVGGEFRIPVPSHW